MSRRRRGYRPGQAAQVGKAMAVKPAATFTAAQVLALAQAQQAGPSIVQGPPLPRDPNWMTVPFGVGTPLIPQGINRPRDGQRQADPRQFEVPVSWNLPGFTDRLVPWAILRNAADIPLFRQCIETRKQEAVTRAWDIRLSDNAVRRAHAASPNESVADIKEALQKKVQPAIGKLIDFWAEPDRWNGRDFTAWVTMLLEEQFVLDAVPIFPRRQRNGDLYGFEVIDGSTIKPLLDDYGRRPLPPYPAYQQVLYGFPRGEFTSDVDLDPETGGQQPDQGTYAADQLVYVVTHTRAFTPYGHSAVERALQDGDLWMRRHGWLKAEYTDGVMPSGWLEAGEGQAEWTPQQLEVFEKAFNDYYAGATPSRQRFRILPWGMKPSKSEDLGEKYKPDYDMFLLKLVVRHFDTTVTELGFSETRGLGSAGFHQGQERLQERTAEAPTLERLGKLLTRLQIKFLGAPPELEFVFPEDEADEQAKEDAIWQARVDSGRATRNEDRDRQGQPRFPFPEADMPTITTGSGLLFVEGASHAAAPGQVFSGGAGMPPGPDGMPPGAPAGGPLDNGPGPAGGPGGPSDLPSGAGPAPAGPAGGQPTGGLTKADLDWLDAQNALTRPGATGLEVAQATLDKADVPLSALAKAELTRHSKWRRNLTSGRVRSGVFAFEHLTKAQALAAGLDTTLLTFKADTTPPAEAAPPNRQWPGWAYDLAAVAAGGAALSAALAATGLPAAITARLASALGGVHGTDDSMDAAATAHLLDELNASVRIQRAIAPVIAGLHSSGAAIGDASARNLVDGTPVPASPKDWSAAARLLTADQGGTGPGLRQMLADQQITIKSIADSQVERLARILADGLSAHQTPAQIGDDIRTLGVDDDRAQMIAHTELSRAMGQAAMDRYQEMGVPGTEWLRAPDDRVCPTCAKNAAAGAVPLGEQFPSGHLFPPGHPRCRCVPAPVLVDQAKADAALAAPAGGGQWDEAKHPRAADGKFGPGGGGQEPTATGAPKPPAVTVADLHAANEGKLPDLKPGEALGSDGEHAPLEMSPAMAAAAQRNQLLAQRNALLAQRLVAHQQQLAAAAARRQAAQAARDAKAKAAAAKKAAAASKKKAGSDAIAHAKQQAAEILAHLDSLAAGKTEAELHDVLAAWSPELTKAEVADLIKAWDPAFHPRDPLTGRFVSVGVRRPAFKPKTRKRWGRSAEEIKAWEWAHAHGEQTRFVDAGRAGARGVGHAQVGELHQVVAAADVHAQPDDAAVVKLLRGRNAAELDAIIRDMGAQKQVGKGLFVRKQAIVDAAKRAREARGGAPLHRDVMARRLGGADVVVGDRGNGPLGFERGMADARRLQVGESIGDFRHHGYNRAQDNALWEAQHGGPQEALDRAANLVDAEIAQLRPEHRQVIADRLDALRGHPVPGVAARAIRIGRRYGVNVAEPPKAPPHDIASAVGRQVDRNAAKRAAEIAQIEQEAGRLAPRPRGTDPVAHVFGELDKVAGDPVAMDRLMEPLDLNQHRQLAVMVGHNAGPVLENPAGIRDAIIGQKLYEHHEARLKADGNVGDVAQALARARARQGVDKLHAHRAGQLNPVPERKPGKVHDAQPGESDFGTEHGRLDAAHGNRAAMADAIWHLQKADLVALGRQRGLAIGDGRAKKDQLRRNFLMMEARRRAHEDARAAGMGEGEAIDHAWQEARKVRDAVVAEQRLAQEAKLQAKARRDARVAEAAQAVDQARRDAAHAAAQRLQRAPAEVQLRPHGTGVTHDEEGYPLHRQVEGGALGGVVDPEHAPFVPLQMHAGNGDIGDQIRAGQAALSAHWASGEVSRRNPDVQGAIGETAIVTHADGAKTVHKAMSDAWYDGRQQADSEELGAHLALHMGLRAPVTRHDPNNPKAVQMEFMDGYQAAAKRFLSYEDSERIRKSAAGRKMALLDVLVGNTDRHSGNWMIRGDDYDNPDIVAIDHGFSFPLSDRHIGVSAEQDRLLAQGLSGNTGRGVFVENLGRHGRFTSNDYTHEEIDNARLALERMKPEFDRMGRGSWYGLAVARLGKVARMSSDSRARALAIEGFIHA